MRVAWFEDRNMKILEVQGGEDMAILKVEEFETGKISFYAFCKTES